MFIIWSFSQMFNFLFTKCLNEFPESGSLNLFSLFLLLFVKFACAKTIRRRRRNKLWKLTYKIPLNNCCSLEWKCLDSRKLFIFVMSLLLLLHFIECLMILLQQQAKINAVSFCYAKKWIQIYAFVMRRLQGCKT